MMKQEFEQLVGKEVTQDTFELYNTMYMALPESINKLQFVIMLDKSMIPEDPSAIERRKRREEFIAEINQEIKSIKEQIAEHERFLQKAREGKNYWKDDEDKFMYNSYKSEAKYYAEQIQACKNRIRDLKFIID